MRKITKNIGKKKRKVKNNYAHIVNVRNVYHFIILSEVLKLI